MVQHIDYDSLRGETVVQVAKMMAAAAITAPKSGGMMFLQGKHNFMETIIVSDLDTKTAGQCGACGYATCAEFLHATNSLRKDSAEFEFAGPVCNLRDIDLGIAVGSAAKTASMHSIDCRCQTRSAVAARKLGIITADHAVALSLSMTSKAVGFDRGFPEVDFDTIDLPSTGTLPVGVAGATRHGGNRNRQQPLQTIRATTATD